MDRICALPGAPHTLLEMDHRRVAVAWEGGILLVEGGASDEVFTGHVGGAARAPDDSIWFVSDGRVLRLDCESGDTTNETSSFALTPTGGSQIRCAPDGEIWVEGCASRRRADGSFAPNPTPLPGTSDQLLPRAWDMPGNRWALRPVAAGMQVAVLPANAPETWQIGWLPAGAWTHIEADRAGGVWVGGATGWMRFCAREHERGWQAVEGVPAAPTATARSPEDRLMAGFADGQILEIDVDASGATVTRALGSLTEPVTALLTDRDGVVWAAGSEGLHRRLPEETAWQRRWRPVRGRFGGGGNHDVFSVEVGGRLFLSGGWAGCWGIPPQRHVLDELFAWDPATEYWTVVSRLRHPRRYQGIAAMNDEVWIVGGEWRPDSWNQDGQVLYSVDIYDPRGDHWRAGPALNVARTDPFVVNSGDRIYAIGGAAHNGGPALDSVESIGPGETAWRMETALPEPTRQGHGCALNGIVYCFSIDGAYAYDTGEQRWQADLPQPGAIGQGPIAAAHEGAVWLIGGHGDCQVRIFDPADRAWRQGPDLPVGLAWGAAQEIGGRLVVAGGAYTDERHGVVVYEDRTFVLR